jgi:hypothetical protein
MTLDAMAREIHEWAKSQGFYDREKLSIRDDPHEYLVPRSLVNPSLPSEKLMLIVTEVAEAQEALRDGDLENEAEEIADVLIRLLDYAAWRGISLDREVAEKMERNLGRPYLHGRSF